MKLSHERWIEIGLVLVLALAAYQAIVLSRIRTSLDDSHTTAVGATVHQSYGYLSWRISVAPEPILAVRVRYSGRSKGALIHPGNWTPMSFAMIQPAYPVDIPIPPPTLGWNAVPALAIAVDYETLQGLKGHRTICFVRNAQGQYQYESPAKPDIVTFASGDVRTCD